MDIKNRLWKRMRPYCNRRMLAVLLLSISSGLPLALVGGTLQAWYTVSGVKLMTIGALTLVGIPYIYKFIWSPLFDRFILNGQLGRRRSWILLTQFAVTVGIFMMAFLDPLKTPWILAMVALGVAVSSASQDIAIDAYGVDVAKPDERGLVASLLSLGYRLAMLLSGAGALILAAKIGWQATYLLMGCIMIVEMLVTFLSPRPLSSQRAPSSMGQAIIEPFKDFFWHRNTMTALVILAFIVLYKFCDALALSLNTTFLIRGVGFSLIDVGAITKVDGLIAALLGSIVGGVLYPRLGLFRALMYYGILQMLSNLAYAVLAVVGKSYSIMAISIFVEYFCGGLSSVAFIAFLMSLCNQRYTATQYALFSAWASIGRVFIGPLAAVMVKHFGWAEFYVWTTIVGLPSLLLLWILKYRIDFKIVHFTEPVT